MGENVFFDLREGTDRSTVAADAFTLSRVSQVYGLSYTEVDISDVEVRRGSQHPLIRYLRTHDVDNLVINGHGDQLLMGVGEDRPVGTLDYDPRDIGLGQLLQALREMKQQGMHIPSNIVITSCGIFRNLSLQQIQDLRDAAQELGVNITGATTLLTVVRDTFQNRYTELLGHFVEFRADGTVHQSPLTDLASRNLAGIRTASAWLADDEAAQITEFMEHDAEIYGSANTRWPVCHIGQDADVAAECIRVRFPQADAEQVATQRNIRSYGRED